MTIVVIRFPGTNNERETVRVLKETLKVDTQLVPDYQAAEVLSQSSVRGVVLPGGFSFGDYLRTGAMAAFSDCISVLKEITVQNQTPVLGICNGFQILTEAGLLDGVLLRNNSTRFICRWINIKVTSSKEVFGTRLPNTILRLPIAHNEGNYYCSMETLKRLKEEDRIVFTYSNANGEVSDEANPNGAMANIAGIVNESGNVLGLMPHPERASNPLLGSTDGLILLKAFVRRIKANAH